MSTWPGVGDLEDPLVTNLEMKDYLEDWLALTKKAHGGTAPNAPTTLSAAGQLSLDEGFAFINGYSGVADTLASIDDTGVAHGRIMLLKAYNSGASPITIEHNAGAQGVLLENEENFVLDDDEKAVLVYYEATAAKWKELTRSWGTDISGAAAHLNVLPVADPTFTGTITGPRARLTAGDDVGLATTDHGFQIGWSGGTNLRMDVNEIMATNNGSADILVLNKDGNDSTGYVTVNNSKVWHAGNGGSGSGLDADTVDGIEAAVLQAGQPYVWGWHDGTSDPYSALGYGSLLPCFDWDGIYDPLGVATLGPGNSKIYLDAGTYRINAWKTFWTGSSNRAASLHIRLNGGAYTLDGPFVDVIAGGTFRPVINGYFAIGAGQYMELSYFLNDHTTYGYRPTTSGQPQYDQEIELWKIS